MAHKHKSVTIRVAAANTENKHKTTLIIDGKSVKTVYITKTDVSGGAVKSLIARWSKLAEHVALVYKGERATYVRKGKEITRVSLVKTAKAGTANKPKTATKPKPATAGKPKTSSGGRRKPTTAQKAKMQAAGKVFRAFVAAQTAAGKTHKQALAAWKVAKAGGKVKTSTKPKVVAKKPTSKPKVVGKPKSKTAPKRKLSPYNKFVASYLAAHPGLGKNGMKKAAAAWKAKNGGKVKTPAAKKPTSKPKVVAKVKTPKVKTPKVVAKKKTTKPKRKLSPYNKFVAAYLAKHPGLGKGGMKKAAAAWKAQGGSGTAPKTKTPGKKKTTGKKALKVVKTPAAKAPRAAHRGALPNPGDVLGAAAMRAARRR